MNRDKTEILVVGAGDQRQQIYSKLISLSAVTDLKVSILLPKIYFQS